jgi:hypothetical protein
MYSTFSCSNRADFRILEVLLLVMVKQIKTTEIKMKN